MKFVSVKKNYQNSNRWNENMMIIFVWKGNKKIWDIMILSFKAIFNFLVLLITSASQILENLRTSPQRPKQASVNCHCSILSAIVWIMSASIIQTKQTSETVPIAWYKC